MKILFLTNIPSPYRVHFFNELGKSCKLTVVFEGRFATNRNKIWQSEEAYHFTPVFLKSIRLGADTFLSFKIIRLLKQKWDVVILGGYSTPTDMLAIEYMRLKKIPFYIETDGGLIHSDNKFKFKIKKHFITAASGYFSSGKETTKFLKHYGADISKIYEYPFSSLEAKDILPVLLPAEQKQILRKELKIKEDKIIISVGRFVHCKGYDILLKAAVNFPKDMGIYIIGAEPTQEYLKLQKDLNLTNVHFVGFQNKESLKKWYRAADVFVLPTREDIWGLVINEAMAQGLPVITTDKCVAGLELIKEGQNGYIVPVENIKALANAITKIFTQDYKTMGQKSLEIIKPYTIENMAKKHLEILNTRNNIKVVHILRGISDGGVATMVRALITAQVKNGQSPIVVSDRADLESFMKWCKEQGISVPFFPIENYRLNKMTIWGGLSRKTYNSIIKEYGKEKTIFHFHNPIACGLLSYIPQNSVCTIHGLLNQAIPGKIAKFIVRKTILRMLKNKVKIIGCCKAVANDLNKNYNTVCQGILNGLGNIEKQNSNYIKENSKIHIGYVSYIDDLKGWHVLANAYKLLKPEIRRQCDLTFAGGICPQDKDKFDTFLKNNKEVNYLGYLPQARNMLMPYLDIFVLPSRTEGLPMSILEAMQQGVIPVATAAGGIPELIIEGQSGYLIKREAKHLAEVIENLIHNKQNLGTMREQVKKRFNEIGTSEIMYDNYYKVYSKLIKK